MLLFCHRLLYQLNVNFHIFHKTLQLLIHCIINFFFIKKRHSKLTRIGWRWPILDCIVILRKSPVQSYKKGKCLNSYQNLCNYFFTKYLHKSYLKMLRYDHPASLISVVTESPSIQRS